MAGWPPARRRTSPGARRSGARLAAAVAAAACLGCEGALMPPLLAGLGVEPIGFKFVDLVLCLGVSTGANVNVCTADDFTKSVDALVYYIDPENEEMKIAYPTMLFDRNITDGRAMMCSVLTLSIGNNQRIGDVEYGRIHDWLVRRDCIFPFL